MRLDIQLFGGRGMSYYKKQVEDWLKGETKRKRGKKPKPLDISKLKNMTMQEAEDFIASKNYENMLIYNAKGELVEGYKGDATSVSFPGSILNNENGIVTHNHPVGLEGFGGTFSFADMYNMTLSNWKEHRAVAKGQGEKTYSLKRNKNANGSGLAKQIAKDESRLIKQMGETFENTYKKIYKKTNNRTAAAKGARQAYTGILSRYYKDNAKKYGFDYIQRKK